jgi:organic radical activating enzyme
MSKVIVFTSVQGEGLHIGQPSLFVRFPGCNLQCDHCDTRYSWDAGEAFTSTLEEAVEAVSRATVQSLVITGGEPLLYPDAVRTLAWAALSRRMSVTVETNGTIAPTEELRSLGIEWSVSPKLPWFLGPRRTFEWDPDTLKQFPDGWLKIVVRPYRKDVEAAVSLAQACIHRGAPVGGILILQPLNPFDVHVTLAHERVVRSYWIRYAKLVDIASRVGNFQGVIYVRPQLHVLAGLP